MIVGTRAIDLTAFVCIVFCRDTNKKLKHKRFSSDGLQSYQTFFFCSDDSQLNFLADAICMLTRIDGALSVVLINVCILCSAMLSRAIRSTSNKLFVVQITNVNRELLSQKNLKSIFQL